MKDKVEDVKCVMSHFVVRFTLMNHNLHCEIWGHLCAHNSVEERESLVQERFIDKKKAFSPSVSIPAAYLPLKRIQPANTRGQRWQA